METTTSGSTVDTVADRARGTVDRATQGAHQAIDRLAAKAGPAVDKAVDKLRSATSNTAETLRAKADALNQWQDQWLQNTRDYVRENPLTALGIGLLAGVLLAKLTSSSSSDD